MINQGYPETPDSWIERRDEDEPEANEEDPVTVGIEDRLALDQIESASQWFDELEAARRRGETGESPFGHWDERGWEGDD